jgi:hypothetical protein
MTGVSHDDTTYLTLPGDQNSDLASQLSGQTREMPGKLGSDHLMGWNAATEGALQRLQLRMLDASDVAVNVSDSTPWDRREQEAESRMATIVVVLLGMPDSFIPVVATLQTRQALLDVGPTFSDTLPPWS